MRLAVPKELQSSECRVAATPETVVKLCAMGFEVYVERGAGAGARMPDADFEAAGATLCASREETLAQAHVVLMVNPPEVRDVGGLPQGALLASLLQPDQSSELLQALAARGVNAIALDKIPRISRAQKMDVLSSMANIAGYRAIVEAASRYGGFFSGQITAAGRTPPAKVLVIGAGVAGLAAIASARALGAVVRAFDVRPAVKEQVESLGASFLELTFESDESGETAGGYAKIMSKEFIDAEMALFAEQAREVDIIVTTALIPGKKAPTLITADMVSSMRAGSVIVDLAAAQGGNVEGTVADSVEEVGGVQIVGFTDLTSRLPRHASQFFGTNLVNLLDDLGGAEDFKLDLEDLVVEQSLAVHDGAVRWPPPPLPPPPAKKEAAPAPAPPPAPKAKKKEGGSPWPVLALAVVLTALAMVTPDDSVLVQQITVFILACFVGWQVVWSVSPALHTPLMSVTNAISGIILVGGMLQAGSGDMNLAAILGAVAILVASINIFGGFFVTHRMLAMFRKEG